MCRHSNISGLALLSVLLAPIGVAAEDIHAVVQTPAPDGDDDSLSNDPSQAPDDKSLPNDASSARSLGTSRILTNMAAFAACLAAFIGLARTTMDSWPQWRWASSAEKWIPMAVSTSAFGGRKSEGNHFIGAIGVRLQGLRHAVTSAARQIRGLTQAIGTDGYRPVAPCEGLLDSEFELTNCLTTGCDSASGASSIDDTDQGLGSFLTSKLCTRHGIDSLL